MEFYICQNIFMIILHCIFLFFDRLNVVKWKVCSTSGSMLLSVNLLKSSNHYLKRWVYLCSLAVMWYLAIITCKIVQNILNYFNLTGFFVAPKHCKWTSWTYRWGMSLAKWWRGGGKWRQRGERRWRWRWRWRCVTAVCKFIYLCWFKNKFINFLINLESEYRLSYLD